MKKTKIKAKRITPLPPVPKLARQRMGKKRRYEEYMRPIEYIAKHRSPKILLYKKVRRRVVKQ
ncbi:MAG: hypothetical protein QXG02_01520 [Candidatus Anstonellales archaeon]